jgi:hypothetical protein
MRFFKSGSVVTSSTYLVQGVRGQQTTAAAAGGATESRIDISGTIGVSPRIGSGIVNVLDANSTDATAQGQTSVLDTTAASLRIDMFAARNTAAGTFSGLRFYANSGQDITAGTFKLYGVKKS